MGAARQVMLRCPVLGNTGGMRAIWKALALRWSPCRSVSTRRPISTTCSSGRCTGMTAAGLCSWPATAPGNRSPSTTSPRAMRPRTAAWSSSTTSTSPTCRARPPRRSASSSSCLVDEIDLMWPRIPRKDTELTKSYAAVWSYGGCAGIREAMAIVTVSIRTRMMMAVLRRIASSSCRR